MKSTSFHKKTPQMNSKTPISSAGPDGVALAPPAYGIESADRAQTEFATQPDREQSLGTSIQMKAELSAAGGEAGARPENNTGLPNALKAGIESLSGLALDDVRVHYNSSKPAALQALAYAQGTDIHVAPGQERHLPHEAWHVVQQKQGRVEPSRRFNSGISLNDSPALEMEADFKGREARDRGSSQPVSQLPATRAAPVQRVIQRHIREVKASPLGSLRINMEARNPRLDNSRAGEYGTISFMPGDEAPDTSRIHLEQLANFEDLSGELPDLDQINLWSQRTKKEDGAEAGFVIDQIVPDLREAFSDELLGDLRRDRPDRFGYAITGKMEKVSLYDAMRAIAQGASSQEIEERLGISRQQVGLMKEWIEWARDVEGFLGDELTPKTIKEAMIKTVMKGEVDDKLLSGATGIDSSVWSSIRQVVKQKRQKAPDEPSVAEVAKEFSLKGTKIQRDAFGMKQGQIRHPASLYDTPSSKRPGRWDFKTAPIDTSTGHDMGIYVRWGFKVKRIQTETGYTAQVDAQSEYSKIELTHGSTYGATARAARKNFDTFWREQQNRDIDFVPPLPPPLLMLGPSISPQVSLGVPQRHNLQLSGMRVVDYKEGQQGVFFVQDGDETFVAKPLQTAMNEALTLKLAARIGIPQPETVIISLKDGAPNFATAMDVISAIQKSKYLGEYDRVFEGAPPRFLMIMKMVHGISLGKAHKTKIDYGDPTQLIKDIGLIAAFDTLIYYQDRTSIIGGGNLENLMMESQDGTLRGVAIDQRTRVTHRESYFSPPHLQTIEEKLILIAKGNEELLGRLWEDLPKPLQLILEKRGGLKTLQEALILGFKQIAGGLDKEAIDSLSESVQDMKIAKKPSSSVFSPPDTDTVDIAALKDSLALVKKYFG